MMDFLELNENSEIDKVAFKEKYELLLEEYLSEVDLSPRSKITYLNALRKFFNYWYDQGLLKLDRRLILNYKSYLNDLSSDTIKSYLSALRSFLSWMDLHLETPQYAFLMTGIKAPKSNQKHKRDPLTSTQIAQILMSIDRNHIKGLRDYAMILLMSTGGLRPIEISESNIEDIGIVFDIPVLFVRTKGYHDKDDYIKLGPETELALREYTSSLYKKTGRFTGPLFVSFSSNWSNGERLSSKGVSKAISRHLVNNHFLPGSRISPYSMRHFTASAGLASSESNKALQEVQQTMRHSRIDTSMIYAHNLDRIYNQTEIRIDHILSEKIKELTSQKEKEH